MPAKGARCFQQFGPQLLSTDPTGVADIHRGKALLGLAKVD